MTVFDTLNSHRSIRSFLTKAISGDLVDDLLQRAVAGSSSSGNLNSYSIIVTRDAKRKKKLCQLHFDQKMIEQAPLLLTFCADHRRSRKWFQDRGAADNFDDFLGFLVGAFDAIIVAQSFTLAAESQGLGICYLGTTLSSADEISSYLELPSGVFPVTSLAVGYPDESPEARVRLPLASLVHQEKYQDFDSDRIDQTFREKEVSGWRRYMSYPGVAEKIKELGITNLAQYYTSAIKYPPDYHKKTSQMLLDLLKQQDFLSSENYGESSGS